MSRRVVGSSGWPEVRRAPATAGGRVSGWGAGDEVRLGEWMGTVPKFQGRVEVVGEGGTCEALADVALIDES